MDELISLSKLFEARIFRIPDYQRGYAWEEAQLVDFWDDLTNLSEERYHYTGMLSLKKLKPSEFVNWYEEKWILDDLDFSAYHVVDGQQRLTTFVILVNSIIKFAEKMNLDYIAGFEISKIKEKYIIQYNKPELISKAFKFGYEKDNPSFEFLRYRVFEEGSSGFVNETFYTLNLENAKNFFDEKVVELYEKEGVKGLSSLFKKLVNRLQFNIHNINDDFDVFVAFETMNNRGKKLSYLEILKNRLIYLTTIYPKDVLSLDAQEQLRRDINDTWKEVYYQLGRNKNFRLNDDEYLKGHWSLHFKYSRTQSNNYTNFLLGTYFNPRAVYGLTRKMELVEEDEDYFKFDIIDETDDILTPNEIKSYVDSLKSTAQYWYYSFNPSDCNWLSKDEIEWIEKLNRIGINYFRTLVVAAIYNQKVTKEERIKLFRVIEKFIFLVFRLSNYNTSWQSHIAYAYAKELINNKRDIESIIKYFEDWFYSEREGVCKSFVNKVDSWFKKGEGYYTWKYLRYVLFEYEKELASQTFIVKMNDWENFIKHKRDKISIEHIYPQTATNKYWETQFENFNSDEKLRLVNSLGNLLALSQSINSSLQNDSFKDKKYPSKGRTHGYSNGSNSEIEVAKYEDWNANAILDRGMHLLSFIESRWDLTFSENDKYKLLGLEFMK